MNNRPVTSRQHNVASRSKPIPFGESPWPFRFVILSLIFEFGRPQEIVPGLRSVPLPSILDALIAASVISSKNLTFQNLQTKLWLPLLAIMFIHTPLAVNNFWAAMTLKDMFLTFCLYLGIITFVNTFERMKTLVSTWLGLHLVTASLGIASGGSGVGGWMGDENDFCMVMNMVVPFAFFMMMSAKGQSAKIAYLCLLCLFVLAAMVTLSRGGFIGLASIGVYCWFKSAQKIRSLLVVCLIVIFMLVFAPQQYWKEIASSTDEETMETGTGAERLYTWGVAWRMFLANPILGVGQGNLPWNIEDYEGGDTFHERSLAGRAAHSMYFTLLPELGLAGVVIFLLFQVQSFRDLRHVEKISPMASNDQARGREECEYFVNLSRAISASLIAYLVSSIFISTLYYPSVWVMIAFCVALRNQSSVIRGMERQRGVANQIDSGGGLRILRPKAPAGV